MAGKGDRYRKVDEARYRAGYDLAFAKTKAARDAAWEELKKLNATLARLNPPAAAPDQSHDPFSPDEPRQP